MSTSTITPESEPAADQPEIQCLRCGDTDGPFGRDCTDWFCEDCLPMLTGGAA